MLLHHYKNMCKASYCLHMNAFVFYYQYQTAEVRFANEDDSIDRFNNPVWNITDDRSSEAIQMSTLNSNASKKSTVRLPMPH